MSIIYLTGMPATGKSSVTSIIAQRSRDIKIVRYSEVLREYLKKIDGIDYTIQDLREKSSQIVFPEHIISLDDLVVQQIEESAANHVILESHAVTIEKYGYRATPFSEDTLKRLHPDLILVLYDKPANLQCRILSDAQGRQLQDTDTIAYGQSLQASLALQYSVLLGTEICFLDGSKGPDYIAQWILGKLHCS